MACRPAGYRTQSRRKRPSFKCDVSVYSPVTASAAAAVNVLDVMLVPHLVNRGLSSPGRRLSVVRVIPAQPVSK